MSSLLGVVAAATLPHVAALTTLLDVPIRFDVGDTVTHAPMVDAVVNGAPMRLILDTGSTDHVLTIELARSGWPSVRAGRTGDWTTPVNRSTRGSSVTWPSRSTGSASGSMTRSRLTGPPPFEGWGVGGFLSPQHLHPTALAVIDLESDRFILVEGDDVAVEAWLRARSPEMR